jgi:hypothetical protein
MLSIARRETDVDLADVASGVFSALGISDWEEGDSSNYPANDQYFAGYCTNAEVEVYDGGDDRTPNYPFHVSIVEGIEDTAWRRGVGTISLESETIAKALAADGFTVFVPSGTWALNDWDGDGDLYTPA